MSDLAEQFVIGTMRGSFIHKLSSLSENIIANILNLQLRVPMLHEKNAIEPTVEADDDKYNKIIDLSRPSDYRMKAIEAKQFSAGLIGDDESHVSGTSRMSTVGTATSSDSVKPGTPYEGKRNFHCSARVSSGWLTLHKSSSERARGKSRRR
jgi:hypothetical protein